MIREALRLMARNKESERLKLERLRAVGAEQAERGHFIDQSVRDIAAEAKREKHG